VFRAAGPAPPGVCESGLVRPRVGYQPVMSDPSEQAVDHEKRKRIDEHEDLDPETILEDAEELFEPDNPIVPPPQPDAPPD
jgi:hypothetical protein